MDDGRGPNGSGGAELGYVTGNGARLVVTGNGARLVPQDRPEHERVAAVEAVPVVLGEHGAQAVGLPREQREPPGEVLGGHLAAGAGCRAPVATTFTAAPRSRVRQECPAVTS
jgi:hypothetical protein